MAVIGLLVTAAASWTAWRIDHVNERQLLAVQTKQAAAVIGGAVVSNVTPLKDALTVASATAGDANRVAAVMAPVTASGQTFTDASLWRLDQAGAVLVTSAGTAPAQSSAAVRAFVRRAARSSTFVVAPLFSADRNRVAYAMADGSFAIYAERAIPPNRQVAAEQDAAFADLEFATYLGRTTATAAVATTNRPLARLPLRGTTARAYIPFGDSTITLVAAPRRHLGGDFAARLPWFFLVAGLVITAVAAILAAQLVRRRRTAEADATTIKSLYEQLDVLYGQQRSVSLTLQHALLPRTNPVIEGVDFASAYIAGDAGVDIGGDWYSVIPRPGGGFCFVVGDVSGRGVDAAAVMAQVRFTLRAYLLEGHPPEQALSMVSSDLDITRDGHFATVLVGVGDVETRTVRCANAGHLTPLVVGPAGVRFAAMAVGPPLGVGPTDYEATTIVMDPGSMLLGYTDGLVERRDEDIDVSLDRLAGSVAPPTGSLDVWLADLLQRATDARPFADDVAILALRWAAADEPAATLGQRGD